jgi:hypothetical protein
MGQKMPSQIDPAIAWLATLAGPQSPKDYLIGQASSLLIKSGQVRPPYDPGKAVPPSVKRIDMAILSRDGMLIPVDGGFIIRLNSQRPLVRQRFACAHEIGHTFFYDISGMRPWRPSQSVSSYWVEEDLCYQFAEEMLMPCREIQRITGGLSPAIDNLLQIRDIFGVSSEALCRRIARLNLWRCILLILAIDAKTSALRRKTVCKHDYYENFSFDWDRLLSPESLAYAALLDPAVVKRSTISGRELFRKGGQREQWRMESIGFGNSSSEKVVIMIIPE